MAQAEGNDEGAPWEHFTSPYSKGLTALRETGFEVGAAVCQVARAGSEEQVAKAREILEDTKRPIYQVLARDVRPSS